MAENIRWFIPRRKQKTPQKARIQNLCKSKNIYQYEVARALGVSENTLVRWLRDPMDEETEQSIINAINELAEGSGQDNV